MCTSLGRCKYSHWLDRSTMDYITVNQALESILITLRTFFLYDTQLLSSCCHCCRYHFVMFSDNVHPPSHHPLVFIEPPVLQCHSNQSLLSFRTLVAEHMHVSPEQIKFNKSELKTSKDQRLLCQLGINDGNTVTFRLSYTSISQVRYNSDCCWFGLQ